MVSVTNSNWKSRAIPASQMSNNAESNWKSRAIPANVNQQQGWTRPIRGGIANAIKGRIDLTPPGMALNATPLAVSAALPSQGAYLEEKARERELSDMGQAYGGLPEVSNYEQFAQPMESAKAFGHKYAPSVENISRGLEYLTDQPLSQQTQLDRYLRLASSGTVLPNSLFGKAVGAVAAPSISARVEGGRIPLPGLNDQLEISPEVADQIGLAATGIKFGRFGAPAQKQLPLYETDVPGYVDSVLNRPGQNKFRSRYEVGNEIRNATPEPVTLDITPETTLSERIPKPIAIQKSKGPISKTVTKSDKSLGIQPVAPHGQILSPKQEVGALFSPGEIRDPSFGGRAVQKQLMEGSEKAKKPVTELYKKSELANSAIQDIHPELYQEIQNTIGKFKDIKSQATPTKKLVKELKTFANTLAIRSPDGTLDYLPVKNQTLIGQIQQFRQMVDNDFVSPTGVLQLFNPTMSAIENSIEHTAKNSPNGQKALDAWLNAKNAYAEWAQMYDNPYTRPFRDKSNKDYSKFYNTALNPDEYSQIAPALENTSKGQALNGAVMRGMVEKAIEPFIKSGKIDAEGLTKALDKLRSVVPEKQINQITNILFKSSPLKGVNITKQTAPGKVKAEKPPAYKYAGQSPEQISKNIDTVSGLRQLKKDLPVALYEKVANFKADDILKKGKLKSSEKASDLKEILNDREKVAILEESLGKPKVEELQRAVHDMEVIEKFLDEIKHAENIPAKEKLLETAYDIISIFKHPIGSVSTTLKFLKDHKLFLKDMGHLAKSILKRSGHSLKNTKFFSDKLKDVLGEWTEEVMKNKKSD